MTEDQTVAALMEETKQSPSASPGTKFTCGCCVDEDYVVEVLEPLLRRAYQAGKAAPLGN